MQGLHAPDFVDFRVVHQNSIRVQTSHWTLLI